MRSNVAFVRSTRQPLQVKGGLGSHDEAIADDVKKAEPALEKAQKQMDEDLERLTKHGKGNYETQ